MKITYDSAKRATTLRERGLDFEDAAEVFAGEHTVEPRFISAGYLRGRMVVLVWTPTENGRRIISMRYCHAKEEKRWREDLT